MSTKKERDGLRLMIHGLGYPTFKRLLDEMDECKAVIAEMRPWIKLVMKYAAQEPLVKNDLVPLDARAAKLLEGEDL